MYRYAKCRDHTILCLECVESLELTICDGPIKRDPWSKNDLNCVFSLTSTRVHVPTIVAWQLGHISLE